MLLAAPLAGLLAVATLLASGAAEVAPKDAPAIPRIGFHGWEALVLRNGVAEVTVVPAIGRVVQFRLLNTDGGGPFWSIRDIGKDLSPDKEGWINYGGDKAWPAPQSDWPAITGRGWPPPRTFDAVAHDATARDPRTVELLSPVDPAYGMRVRRTISLDAAKAVMTIDTSYEKVDGPPITVAVWTITQLGPPERMFIRLPAPSSPRSPPSYVNFLPAPPDDLKVKGRLLSLARDPVNKTMIGSEGKALLWVGPGADLLIADETPPPRRGPAPPARPRGRSPGPPQDTVRTQIYTSPGAAQDNPYVELELVGPLTVLKPGEKTWRRARYQLIPRRAANPFTEAAAVLGKRR